MYLRLQNPGVYEQILKDNEGRTSASTDDIEKDLHRSRVFSFLNHSNTRSYYFNISDYQNMPPTRTSSESTRCAAS